MIGPPTPVGNIAATIEAPNLSITSGGVIQNVGNVIGTSVSLAGQSLINGITTASTDTPPAIADACSWNLGPRFPDRRADFLERRQRAGQARPVPLLLR